MQVIVKSVAQVRDIIGDDDIEVAVDDGATMDDLKAHLIKQDKKWQDKFASPVLMACNQTLVTPGYTLSENDEVAILPPVSGE